MKYQKGDKTLLGEFMSKSPIKTKFSEHKTNQLARCSKCGRIIDKDEVITKKTEIYLDQEWDSYFCTNCTHHMGVDGKVEVRP